MGKVEEQVSKEPAEFNKVIRHSPSANTTVEMEGEVTITIDKKVQFTSHPCFELGHENETIWKIRRN